MKRLRLILTVFMLILVLFALVACGKDEPACRHTYESAVHTPATCLTEGELRHTCTKCQDCYSESIALIPHSMVDGRCELCLRYQSSEGIVFSLNDDGKSYTAEYGSDEITNVVIDLYNGLPVTEIKMNSFKYCRDITGVIIGDSVKIIGAEAFSYCTNLETLTLGKNVERIDTWAFLDCNKLTDVYLPDGLTYFGVGNFNTNTMNFNEYDNAYYLGSESNPYLVLMHSKGVGIETCIIHEDTKIIVYRAFVNHYNLTEITIPDSVRHIDSFAFGSCRNLKTVNLGNGVEIIGDAFCYTPIESIVIPDSVKTLGVTFSGCDLLKNVSIGAGVTKIREGCFDGCTSLAEIKVSENNTGYKAVDGNLYSKDGKALLRYAIGNTQAAFSVPDGVEKIGIRAFRGAVNLTDIVLPDSVTEIGYLAFSGCSNLENLRMSGGIANMYDADLASCNKLKLNTYENGIYLGNEDNPYIVLVKAKNDTIRNCTVYDGARVIAPFAFAKHQELRSVIIPGSVIEIGASAFDTCPMLSSVSILDGVKVIGNAAFHRCRALEGIVIPDSVTLIDQNAFYECDMLQSVTLGRGITELSGNCYKGCICLTEINIPDTVTRIDVGVFRGCTALTEIVIPSSVTYISAMAFDGCDNLTICCEVDGPQGNWHENWNYTACPVVWGYKAEQ